MEAVAGSVAEVMDVARDHRNVTWVTLSFLFFLVLQHLSMFFSSFFQTYSALPYSLRTVDRKKVRARSSKVIWASKVVSQVHALLVLPTATYCFLFEEGPKLDPLYGSSELTSACFALSCGYFLWDLYLTFFYLPDFGTGFLLHATFCSVLYMSGLIPFLQHHGAFFLLLETSTVFLNAMFFAEETGVGGKALATAFGLGFALSFFVVRCVLSPYVSLQVWKLLLQPHAPVHPGLVALVLGGNIVLNVLNFFWMYKIVLRLVRTFSRPKTA